MKPDLGKLLACDECRSLIPRYIAGGLDAETAGRVRGHVGVCEGCDLFLGGQIAVEVSAGRMAMPAFAAKPAPDWLRRLDRIIEEARKAEELVDVSRSFMELRDRFADSLRAFLQDLTPWNDSDLVLAINRIDPLAVVPAAEGPAEMACRIETSPTYYTRLLAPPESISWKPSDSGPWRIQVRTISDEVILKQTVDTPSLPLPDSVRESFPRDVEIYWDVRRADALPESAPMVRGVFSVLPETEAAQVHSRLKTLKAGPPKAYREMAIAAHFLKSQLYDPLIRYLCSVTDLYPDKPSVFVVQRALAASHGAVYRELTGTLMMGIPEGLWAAEMANHHLQAAYRALRSNDD
jgi:hypothetical protein